MNKSDWLSERIIFGVLFIAGFIGLAACGMFIPGLTDAQRQYGREALLVLGPIAGMVAQAVFKTDKADKQNADTVNTLAGAVVTAQALPPVVKA